tara:strand:+ start:3135 stop:4475 length:1341 start_codon:yes stop_codon:yes gene_type:complete
MTIPVHSLEQFTAFDGWLAAIKPALGFQLSQSANKLSAPAEDSSSWQWHSVHASEARRIKQAYDSPDLTDPIRCSYMTFTTPVKDTRQGRLGTQFIDQEMVIDVEPCRTFHDPVQKLHVLWVGDQTIMMEKLQNGEVETALGIENCYDEREEQIYFDGRSLYRLPWPRDAALNTDTLLGANARPVNEEGTVWSLKVAAVPMTAAADWVGLVPKHNCTVFIYVPKSNPSLWWHTPAISAMSLDNTLELTTGRDGIDKIDKELTLTLNFALDAARIVGRWCGAGAVDALELPKIMLALQTVNLSNLHPAERDLTPISMTFSCALAWLMGRSKVCETTMQCLDFRTLYTDLFMRRSCVSVNRVQVRKKNTQNEEIPLLSVKSARDSALKHISRRETGRNQRRSAYNEKRKKQQEAAEKAHKERLEAQSSSRRKRRGRRNTVNRSYEGAA